MLAPSSSERKYDFLHGVRITPLRIATFALDISANVTGRDSRIDVALRGGGISSVDVMVPLSTSTDAEKGRGVLIG